MYKLYTVYNSNKNSSIKTFRQTRFFLFEKFFVFVCILHVFYFMSKTQNPIICILHYILLHIYLSYTFQCIPIKHAITESRDTYRDMNGTYVVGNGIVLLICVIQWLYTYRPHKVLQYVYPYTICTAFKGNMLKEKSRKSKNTMFSNTCRITNATYPLYFCNSCVSIKVKAIIYNM